MLCLRTCCPCSHLRHPRAQRCEINPCGHPAERHGEAGRGAERGAGGQSGSPRQGCWREEVRGQACSPSPAPGGARAERPREGGRARALLRGRGGCCGAAASPPSAPAQTAAPAPPPSPPPPRAGAMSPDSAREHMCRGNVSLLRWSPREIAAHLPGHLRFACWAWLGKRG